MTRINLAYHEPLVGRHEDALRDLQRARALCRAAGTRRREGYALHNLGLAMGRAGDADGGLGAQDAALAIAQEIDEPRLDGLLHRRAYRGRVHVRRRRRIQHGDTEARRHFLRVSVPGWSILRPAHVAFTRSNRARAGSRPSWSPWQHVQAATT
jgi:hypothetical protein